MTTFDFNIPIKDGKGQPTSQLLCDTLADLLLTENKGNARKLYIWGTLLAHGKSLVLDSADRKTLVNLLEDSERLIVLAKAQALEVLDNTKDEAA